MSWRQRKAQSGSGCLWAQLRVNRTKSFEHKDVLEDSTSFKDVMSQLQKIESENLACMTGRCSDRYNYITSSVRNNNHSMSIAPHHERNKTVCIPNVVTSVKKTLTVAIPTLDLEVMLEKQKQRRFQRTGSVTERTRGHPASDSALSSSSTPKAGMETDWLSPTAGEEERVVGRSARWGDKHKWRSRIIASASQPSLSQSLNDIFSLERDTSDGQTSPEVATTPMTSRSSPMVRAKRMGRLPLVASTPRQKREELLGNAVQNTINRCQVLQRKVIIRHEEAEKLEMQRRRKETRKLLREKEEEAKLLMRAWLPIVCSVRALQAMQQVLDKDRRVRIYVADARRSSKPGGAFRILFFLRRQLVARRIRKKGRQSDLIAGWLKEEVPKLMFVKAIRMFRMRVVTLQRGVLRFLGTMERLRSKIRAVIDQAEEVERISIKNHVNELGWFQAIVAHACAETKTFACKRLASAILRVHARRRKVFEVEMEEYSLKLRNVLAVRRGLRGFLGMMHGTTGKSNEFKEELERNAQHDFCVEDVPVLPSLAELIKEELSDKTTRRIVVAIMTADGIGLGPKDTLLPNTIVGPESEIC
ncbi:hypothetical protein GUITHDRAFT_146972 [Guillardia theta CCMP2712]|uniref:Uncharacterized protein n=1 Tax=Guillardia theta (strain CCMP2712) TaxID=905079 RepID=L1IFS5_GUITC|nr:hypothetical protein GUITHDRAFT_146972 [Guillardia theta CCMP2712]EKX34759.1 hypothetical protein GUITHDRAFT_146972 [Guillardia theta CCMP2712]|eukprot:XP_005821739.1 hypothetical protein GUITHDRAFT_146972 [Guillardia theta CCMP2712]